jgi:diaminopimelate epimerase
MKGGTLTIGWAPETSISMRGRATLVFTGSIDLDAFAA